MKVASVRRTAEFYYRRSTFHVHPVSSILTENRAALKESSFRSAKEIVCTDFGRGSLRSRLIVAAVLFVREASTIARRSRRLIRKASDKRARNNRCTDSCPLDCLHVFLSPCDIPFPSTAFPGYTRSAYAFTGQGTSGGTLSRLLKAR